MAAITTAAYPRPRISRPGGIAVAAPTITTATPPAPRGRILAFSVSCNTGLRTTGSSASIRGPALLLDLHVVSSQASLGNIFLELGVAGAPVAESDVAVTAPKAWQPLTERVSQNPIQENVNRIGFSEIGGQANVPRHLGPLNVPVLLDNFFITFSVISIGVLGTSLQGHLVVLENVNPDALASFL